jgi:poly(3-hydroxybutyrate) depolymerase
MLYQSYQAHNDLMWPARTVARASGHLIESNHPPQRQWAAACEVMRLAEVTHRRPDWAIDSVTVAGEPVPVVEEVVQRQPFGTLLRFAKPSVGPQPKVLIVAPMSGHYATLLRGTVEAFLPNHDVYITEWVDARMVPVAEGRFDLDDYIDYVISMLHALNGGVHVVAVCQPSVPVLAAVARMESESDPHVPLTMTLMGGPIDTREHPTAVNKLAQERGIEWFRSHVITKVPFPHPGFMRDVYPGFLQLNGFMTMNLDRHIEAHRNLFRHLVSGDGDSATKHREFYDEYLAVMDLSAEYYLQTVETVFIRHDLPLGTMKHRGRPVDLTRIKRVGLLTIEGEHDDISGVGQTEATHKLCTNIPDNMKAHYLQPGVGHYGVFNGSRFRSEIQPRISDFMLSHNGTGKRPALKVVTDS